MRSAAFLIVAGVAAPSLAQTPFDPCRPETPQETARLDAVARRYANMVRADRKQACEDQKKRAATQHALEAQEAAQAKRRQQAEMELLAEAEKRKRAEKVAVEVKMRESMPSLY